MSVDDDVTGTELGLFRGFNFNPVLPIALLTSLGIVPTALERKKRIK